MPDIRTLDITDHNQTGFPRPFHQVKVGPDTIGTVPFEEGNINLDRRNVGGNEVNDFPAIGQQGLYNRTQTGTGLKLIVRRHPDAEVTQQAGRESLDQRIKPHASRGVLLADGVYQTVTEMDVHECSLRLW